MSLGVCVNESHGKSVVKRKEEELPEMSRQESLLVRLHQALLRFCAVTYFPGRARSDAALLTIRQEQEHR